MTSVYFSTSEWQILPSAFNFNRYIYAPYQECRCVLSRFFGKRYIFIGCDKILQISEKNKIPSGFDVEVFDTEGLIIVPGLIDNHVHIAGTGGEGGPAIPDPRQINQLIHHLICPVTSSYNK